LATLENFYTKITNLGISGSLPERIKRKVQLTNIMGCIHFFAVFTLGSIFFAYKLIWIGAICVLWLVLLALVLLSNWQGHHRSSRIGFLLTSNLAGFAVSVLLGKFVNFHMGFHCMVFAPFVVFNYEEKREIVALSLFPVVLYFLVEFIFLSWTSPFEISGFAAWTIRNCEGLI